MPLSGILTVPFAGEEGKETSSAAVLDYANAASAVCTLADLKREQPAGSDPRFSTLFARLDQFEYLHRVRLGQIGELHAEPVALEYVGDGADHVQQFAFRDGDVERDRFALRNGRNAVHIAAAQAQIADPGLAAMTMTWPRSAVAEPACIQARLRRP